MPISPIKLQRRMAELGRIRLGHKAPTSGGKTRPAKLATFRFTSPSERYIADLAALYGGTAQPWDNNGKPEFEVFTEAKSIPVIAVKGGLSQWMETWSGGGCVHRCDGERDVEGNLCDESDPQHQAAKPTTRLSIMLPELEAIGAWRLESHGWNAAAEIPAVAELAQFVGDLVPANLNLVERRAIKDGQTSRFVVPVLDLQIGTARLQELVNQKAGLELAAGGSTEERPALAAPATPTAPAAEQTPAAPAAPQVTIPTPAQIAAADLATIGRMVAYLQANLPADHPAIAAAQARAQQLVDAAVPDADGAYEAVIVEDPPADAAPAPAGDGPSEPNPDAVWQQIVTVGGRLGMKLPDITEDCVARLGGVLVEEASGAELLMYLTHLQGQEQQAVAS